MKPAGGTEIQYDYLKKYVPKGLLDKVQITTSVPEKDPLHPRLPNILWIKNSWDQPNLFPWFKEKKNHDKYQYYVFNSHWTYEKYRMYFDVPDTRSVIIKNAIDYDELVYKTEFKKKDKIKMIYFSTPWRGLDVLLEAMKELEDDKDISLDVYSSTIIYGNQFHSENDKAFQALYEKAKSIKNVNYKGYMNHAQLLSILHTYDINVHPSTWEETFCISAMESLAAGLVLITTNLGAIPETCTEFPIYMPYTKNKEYLKVLTKQSILDAKNTFKNEDLSSHLKFQQHYYKTFYDWKHIANFWKRFITGVTYETRRLAKEQREKNKGD